MDIRHAFLDLGKQRDYTLLAEKPMVRHAGDTFFVSAAVAAHIDLFDAGRHSRPARYITAQRIFSGTRLEDVGRYPLATSFEVSLSIFRFGDDSAEPALTFVHDFLRTVLGVQPSDMIYLAPHELGLRESVLANGIPASQVLSWEHSIPLRLGPNRPEGHYIKLFMPYRHGVIPLATLGLMELDGKLAVDSALFLERFGFITAGLPHWYASPYFTPIISVLQQDPALGQLSGQEQYLWANHMRALAALLWDGATPSGKGPGHMLRKMARQLAGTIAGAQLSPGLASGLAQATAQSMQALGYDIGQQVEAIAATVARLVNDSSRQIARELELFSAAIKSGPLSQEQLEHWKSERGLQIAWMQRAAERLGAAFDVPAPEARFWFRNECYSFDETQRISDPIAFVRDSEDKRMKGVN